MLNVAITLMCSIDLGSRTSEWWEQLFKDGIR